MKNIDLIAAAPHVYTLAGPGLGWKPDAALAVDRGRILAVGPKEEIFGQYRAERVIDRPDRVMLPGFIDAHMHTGDCLLRGLAQDVGYWMMHGLGPFAPHVGPEARDAGNQLAMLEGLKAGTTTFGEFGRDMDPVASFVEQSGVRALLTIKVREAVERVYEPGELYEFDPGLGEQTLTECLEGFDRRHDSAGGRIRVLFGPQGPDFLSREMLLRVRDLALERKAKIHMHVQQGDRETYQIEKRYGLRPAAWLDQVGYLDENLIAVHLTDASEDEAALVARRGASMILCSGSIGIIDGLVPPARAFQEAGGSVALGSDQAPGNNCHNIFNEMKLTALFNKIRSRDPEVMPAWRALKMATIEGARALGMDHLIGSLEEGKRADFILVDLTAPTMSPVFTTPMRNIVPNLVYSARGDEVDLAAVDGEVILDHGRPVYMDEKKITARAASFTEEIGARASEEFHRIHGKNAEFMAEDKL